MNLNDEGLSRWINCLHEGDLSALRSFLGCNNRLYEISKYTGINNFILTKSLGRGAWVPLGFETIITNQSSVVSSSSVSSDVFTPSEKVCADVIESLIGLIYLNFGYDASIEVSKELGICPKVQASSKHNLFRNCSTPKVERESCFGSG